MGVKGADRHAARLRALVSPAIRQRIGGAIFAGAGEIATEAKLSITAGSVSGKGHVASSPGEPPNRDTGDLDSKIETTRTDEMKAEVQSHSDHGLRLEFGTSKMEERPHLRPATAKLRDRPAKLVAKVINAVAAGR